MLNETKLIKKEIELPEDIIIMLDKVVKGSNSNETDVLSVMILGSYMNLKKKKML